MDPSNQIHLPMSDLPFIQRPMNTFDYLLLAGFFYNYQSYPSYLLQSCSFLTGLGHFHGSTNLGLVKVASTLGDHYLVNTSKHIPNFLRACRPCKRLGTHLVGWFAPSIESVLVLPGVPKQSPIQLLSWPKVDLPQYSKGFWCFPHNAGRWHKVIKMQVSF